MRSTIMIREAYVIMRRMQRAIASPRRESRAARGGLSPHHYEVQTPDGPMLLRIDEHCPRLQVVHAGLGVGESVFLTAWNPLSVPQCAPRNAVAQARLDQRLAALRAHRVAGMGS